MGRKEVLLGIIRAGREAGRELARSLGVADKSVTGTYERWAPKDGVAHVAEWLARDLAKMTKRDEPAPVITRDNIESTNQAIYDEHASKSWDQVIAFFGQTIDDAYARVEAMSEEDVNGSVEHADGSSRTVWRMLAGHALMHLAGHFAMIYRRLGKEDIALALEKRTASDIAPLDDSSQWQGTVKYNLACAFALSGDSKRALELLDESVKLESTFKAWAKEDEDLASLHADPAFQVIVAE